MVIYRYKLKSGGEFVIKTPQPLTEKELKFLENDILGSLTKKEIKDEKMDRAFDNTCRSL